MHDRDRSGKLENEKFVKCLHIANMNASQREIELLVKELDQHDSGVIDYEEFVNCCFLSYLFQKEYKLRMLFEECDGHKQGTITLRELRIILESEEIKLSSEQLDRIFKNDLGIDLSQIDSKDPISYDLFLTCLRKEYMIEK
jgi:Ca2+-binding EF-hand superfamily protein